MERCHLEAKRSFAIAYNPLKRGAMIVSKRMVKRMLRTLNARRLSPSTVAVA